MKEIVYTCNKCGNRTRDIDAGWIEISSEENSLSVKSSLPNRRIEKLHKHKDIHFCCQKCFVGYFIINKED